MLAAVASRSVIGQPRCPAVQLLALCTVMVALQLVIPNAHVLAQLTTIPIIPSNGQSTPIGNILQPIGSSLTVSSSTGSAAGACANVQCGVNGYCNSSGVCVCSTGWSGTACQLWSRCPVGQTCQSGQCYTSGSVISTASVSCTCMCNFDPFSLGGATPTSCTECASRCAATTSCPYPAGNSCSSSGGLSTTLPSPTGISCGAGQCVQSSTALAGFMIATQL